MTLGKHSSADGDRLLVSVARRDWRWLAGLACGSLALSGAALLLPAVLGRAVDAAVARSGSAGWVAACALVVGVFAVSETTNQLALGVTTANATARLRESLAGHVLRIGHRLPEHGGDTVSRVVGSAADAGSGPASGVTSIAAIVPPAGALIALGLLDPWLPLAFAIAFPSLVLMLRHLARDSSRIATDYGRTQGAITARLLDALAGARTIAAAGTQDAERRRILALLPELRGHGYATWRVQARAAAQSTVITPVLQVIMVAVAGLELARHHLTPGGLAAASQYAVLATGIGASTAMVARLGTARGGARRVAELLALRTPEYGTRPQATIPGADPGLSRGDDPPYPPRYGTRPQATIPGADPGLSRGDDTFGVHPRFFPGDTPGPPNPPKYGTRPAGTDAAGELAMRGVTAWRGGQAVLRGLDLIVPGGTAVAIVGRSGAGKSTLAELAGRLADPEEGTVSLDGADLRSLTRTTLRRAVVYAFERPHPFGATPGEAIGFGPAETADSEIRAAAAAAQAAPFIERLPRGYDTALDSAPLSGGEMQRLGLARAFAHAGPARLLILDDATSSLDTITEMLVSQAITERLRGRTRLIVAHRAATAARADLVAWLEEGRIRALAPHADLWQDPDYRGLWCAPAASDGLGGTPDGKNHNLIGRAPQQCSPEERSPDGGTGAC